MSTLPLPSQPADPTPWFRSGITQLVDSLDDPEIDALCDLFMPRVELRLVSSSPVENR